MRPWRVLLSVVAVAFIGCSGEDGVRGVSLPETPVLSARESWGVADKPYVRVYESADEEAAIVGHLRSGIVCEITARIVSPVGDGRDGWVQIGQEELDGWVRRREIELYDTRERAENAARAIRRD